VLPEVLRDSSWLRDAALVAAAKGGGLELGDSLSQQLDAAWSCLGLAVKPGEGVIVVRVPGAPAALKARLRSRSVLLIEDESRFGDWRLRPELLAACLSQHPAHDLDSYRALQAAIAEQRRRSPLVADEAADRVLLDLVLNRLDAAGARGVLEEAWRVLRPSGSLALSIVLADEQPSGLPLEGGKGLRLHSVPLESRLPGLLREAGWDAIRFAWRADVPLKLVEGVEFRLHLVEARKRMVSAARDRGHAVIYRGPFEEVKDGDGVRYVRGQRTAVSDAAFEALTAPPYADAFLAVPPYSAVPAELAPAFDEATPRLRHPRVTKGSRSVFDERPGAANGSSCCPPPDAGKG
jgi:arsenite methyltransferase